MLTEIRKIITETGTARRPGHIDRIHAHAYG